MRQNNNHHSQRTNNTIFIYYISFIASMEQQKFRIPYMAGLAAELSDRVTEALSLSEPRIEGDIASHSGIICTSYDVLVNNAVIGTAQVTTYEQAGRTVIHNVGYRG